MSATRRILVFGLPGIKQVRFDDDEMSFVDSSSADHLANYDIVIYCTGAFEYKYEKGSLRQIQLATIPAEAIRRENEIRSALEKGRIVCFVGSHDQDYVVSGTLRSYNIQSYLIHERDIFRKLGIRRSEFKSFIDNVGATRIAFIKTFIDDIICSVNQHHVVGFSKRIKKGLLLHIPCVWGSKEINYLVDHLKKLAIGLISYSARMIQEPPSYLASFQFTNERAALDKKNRIEKEDIAPLQEKIRYYKKIKSILWLGNNNLVSATNEFLINSGFQTHVDEIYEEDLWILDEDEKAIIIEVKSKNKNLTRVDISKFDEHREARKMPNLTGLLIANTFMVADSIETKDQPFPPNVIEKAVNTNVLITRTLDLCRIYEHLEKHETQPPNILLKSITGQKGWLTFQDDKITVVSS
ncbi:MAG: hypothetical protein O2U62_04490 [Candidatus Bathyarchaeota archaeon]|nr:hypothetical protein [Candidatus Bathyarchaeota archaeon]